MYSPNKEPIIRKTIPLNDVIKWNVDLSTIMGILERINTYLKTFTQFYCIEQCTQSSRLWNFNGLAQTQALTIQPLDFQNWHKTLNTTNIYVYICLQDLTKTVFTMMKSCIVFVRWTYFMKYIFNRFYGIYRTLDQNGLYSRYDDSISIIPCQACVCLDIAT